MSQAPPEPNPVRPAEAPLLCARGLRLRHGGRTVLDAVDLDLWPGEIVTVIGPNGAGKSSLLRLLLGLLAADGGRVERRAGLRIGYAPQRLGLDPTMPLTVGRFLTMGERAERAALLALLARVGLGSRLLDRQMSVLSGGEQSRVLLARAMLRRPHLLVLDEPLSGVDVAGQAELYRVIQEVRDQTGAGVLLVSHDLHLVMARTDRVLCLDGHVCCAGAPLEVAADPAFQRLFGPRLGSTMALYRHDLAHHQAHHADHAPSPAVEDRR